MLDIGSNTGHLLVVDAHGGAAPLPAYSFKEPLRLAEGAAALGLSPQQREVAVMMAQGHSNQAIAEHMGVSLNTASYHVKQVFQRLDVHERTAVAKLLAQAASQASR